MIDVIGNIRAAEFLKIELLKDISLLFESIIADNGDVAQNNIANSISNVIVHSYVLGRRLGIDYAKVNELIRDKLVSNINDRSELEEQFHDLSALLKELNYGFDD